MGFDYIIVGAGSAGCVLADRLSAPAGSKVLVIEAGGSDARFWIKVPLGYGMTFADPKVNWRYHAEPDSGLKGRTAYWPRGRVVGGSSSINAMAYVRGLAHDFDNWEKAGATGWNWDTARAAYERVENHRGDAQTRGNGPLCVSNLRAQMHPFSAHFIKAAHDLGWPTTQDMNHGSGEGLSYFRSTVRDGYRCSAADAFLRPALKRGGVKLVKHALVEKLLFTGLRATGVQYRVGGQQVVATTKGEVIVSAGAINSPQLLQLSGLGPAALLKAYGIDVVQNLGQVGQGMQDHLSLTQHFAATEPTLNARLGSRIGRMLVGAQYLMTRKGPLSVPINQVGGFIRSDGAQAVPNMQIYCNPVSSTIDANGKPQVDRAAGFILSVQPCRPTSRGEVNIASADPTDAPRIQPNSLSTEHDRDEAIRAGRVLQALAKAPSIARVTKMAKAPDISAMDDAALLENFRARAVTNYHPTCTCRMGTDAATSVLDARLRVHGIEGLRVVDASAFPNLTSGNTNAPTIMLAMRAADLILEDRRIPT
jgi:choline dehydrogenase